jgi:rare lipoprotein A
MRTAKRRPASSFRLPPSAFLLAAALTVTLSGCGTTAKRDTAATPPPRGGGYYLDDGPGANPPADLDRIPDAVPRLEPLHRGASRPYVVMGRAYTPMTELQPYRARGIATWYGRRYHGKTTSIGEIYDMYAMTAAHTTLPLPSYARVTNLANGRSVVVRVNDRGPFIGERLIDLSYAAAHRIGLVAAGSAMVEVEAIIPGRTDVAAAAPRPEPAPAWKPEVERPVAASAPAAEAPSPASAPQPIPLTADATGYYLQLGAFGSRDNAENFLARMKAQMGALGENLHVHARDGLFRVHAGPYPSQPEARQAADRLAEAFGLKPFVLTR